MLDWKVVSQELPDENEEVLAIDIDGNFCVGRIEVDHGTSVTGYACFSDDGSNWIDDCMAWTELPSVYLPEIKERWKNGQKAMADKSGMEFADMPTLDYGA